MWWCRRGDYNIRMDPLKVLRINLITPIKRNVKLLQVLQDNRTRLIVHLSNVACSSVETAQQTQSQLFRFIGQTGRMFRTTYREHTDTITKAGHVLVYRTHITENVGIMKTEKKEHINTSGKYHMYRVSKNIDTCNTIFRTGENEHQLAARARAHTHAHTHARTRTRTHTHTHTDSYINAEPVTGNTEISCTERECNYVTVFTEQHYVTEYSQ
jgi:hypothetical protein